VPLPAASVPNPIRPARAPARRRGTVTLSGNCDFPVGTVIRQTPAAGTSASRGTAVNLVEATPPKPHGCAQ